LAKVINGEGAKPKFRIKEGPQGGLEGETEADLGKGYKLVYNKTLKGYTFDFRPDFSLIKDEKNLEIVFDAKFRFDLKELDKDKDLKKLEEAEEEAIREGNLEKVVKVDDVYKMHTYRDALQCRAAIVVYPGDSGCFYYVSRKKENYSLSEVEENLKEVIEKFEGVGFIGLNPIEND